MRCPECKEDSLFLHTSESCDSSGPYDEEWYRCANCYSDFDAEEIDTYYEDEDGNDMDWAK